MKHYILQSVKCGISAHCAAHPSITALDVIVEIYEDSKRQNQWRISHESLFEKYVESLLPVSCMSQGEAAKLQSYDTNRLFKAH